jgi:hypothetical protein
MKDHRKFQRAAGTAALALGLSMGGDIALAQVPGNPGVVQPSSSEFGNTYGEWSARWWQWGLSIPADKNPILDTTGAHCAEAQADAPQVWFLAGTFGGDPVVRKCTIPGGKDLYLPILNSLFGQAPEVGDCEGPQDCDPTALRSLAAAQQDDPQLLEVSIDNHAVKNLNQYRVTSPVFNAFLPQGNVIGIPAGTIGPLVSDGYWLLLTPLSAGKHTIHFHGKTVTGFETEATYQLNISP